MVGTEKLTMARKSNWYHSLPFCSQFMWSLAALPHFHIFYVSDHLNNTGLPLFTKIHFCGKSSCVEDVTLLMLRWDGKDKHCHWCSMVRPSFSILWFLLSNWRLCRSIYFSEDFSSRGGHRNLRGMAALAAYFICSYHFGHCIVDLAGAGHFWAWWSQVNFLHLIVCLCLELWLGHLSAQMGPWIFFVLFLLVKSLPIFLLLLRNAVSPLALLRKSVEILLHIHKERFFCPFGIAVYAIITIF